MGTNSVTRRRHDPLAAAARLAGIEARLAEVERDTIWLRGLVERLITAVERLAGEPITPPGKNPPRPPSLSVVKGGRV
jgi:hypothetical protein